MFVMKNTPSKSLEDVHKLILTNSCKGLEPDIEDFGDKL